MNNRYHSIINTATVAVGALLVPLLSIGTSVSTWGLHLTALILMAIVLAAMNLQWQQRWLLLMAGVLAIVGSFANWTLLPLAIAQIVLALLITTQDMQPPLKATSLIAQIAFLQVLITMAGTQVLTRTFIMQLIFTTIPFIVAAWSSKLPVWLTAIIIVALAATGYFLQVLTILVALLTIIWALLPLRLPEKMPTWYWALAVPVLGFVLQLTILHG
jgi:hypothetical protein